MVKQLLPCGPALLCILCATSPAQAITAGEVVDRMSLDEQNAYVSGAVDMYSYLFASNGNREKADCAVNWYFGTDGSVREVFGVFENYKDKDPMALVGVLIDRHCSGQ